MGGGGGGEGQKKGTFRVRMGGKEMSKERRSLRQRERDEEHIGYTEERERRRKSTCKIEGQGRSIYREEEEQEQEEEEEEEAPPPPPLPPSTLPPTTPNILQSSPLSLSNTIKSKTPKEDPFCLPLPNKADPIMTKTTTKRTTQ